MFVALLKQLSGRAFVKTDFGSFWRGLWAIEALRIETRSGSAKCIAMLLILKKNPLLVSYISWGIALLAMIISLIFSEFLKFPPCTLCWYQRVFMYPLVFILPIGIFLEDSKISYYSLVLSGFGGAIALYHSLIYHGFIQEALKVCSANLSCKTKQFELFEVLSIPVMSLLSFVAIFLLSLTGANCAKKN